MKTLTWAGNMCLQLRKPVGPWAASKLCVWQVEGGDSPPLLCSHETPPGVLLSTPELSAQERHRLFRVGPEEDH